jgi:hypothetical protein
VLAACGAADTTTVVSTVTVVSGGTTEVSTITGSTTIVRTLIDEILQAGPPILKVHTSPGATCRPTAFDSSGQQVHASWLVPKQAGGDGVIEWDAPNSSASSSGTEGTIASYTVVCALQGTSITTATTFG